MWISPNDESLARMWISPNDESSFFYDAAFVERRTDFFRRYHLHKSPRRELLIRPGDKYLDGPDFDSRATDATIKLGKSGRTWSVHQDIMASHSNFFKRAFACGLKESKDKLITLEEVSERGVDFVINYVYNGWDSAVEKTFGVSWDIFATPRMPLVSVLDVILFSDYLDMPYLAYEAYAHLVDRVADLAISAKSDIQFAHNLCVREKDFKHVADELIKSTCVFGQDLGKKILKFLKKLKGVHDFTPAAEAFKSVFPEERHLMDQELLW